MSTPSNFQDIPNPDTTVAGNNHTESGLSGSLEKQAKLWRPRGAKETTVATLSRFATRLIDRVTGRAYSSDEFEAKINAAMPTTLELYLPYDGEPTNYVAATAMTATYTADTNKTIALTAKTAGVLSPAPSLDIVDPAAPSATLAISENLTTRVVTITPATGVGDAAVHLLDTGVGGVGHRLTTTLTAAGPGGNAKTLRVFLPSSFDVFGAAITQPSQTLSCNVHPTTYTVYLATTAGEMGFLTLTESSADPGEIAITQAAAYAGAWGNTQVRARVTFSGVSSSFSVTSTITGGNLDIVINLATDADGLPIGKPDDDVKTAIEAALVITDNNGTPVDLSACFVVESAGTGNFDTAQAFVSMAGGVDAVGDDAANTATLVAAAIAGAEGIATVGIDAGTDVVAVTAASAFTGGGANAAITSTLQDLETLLATAGSTLIGGVIGVGDGATLLTDSTTALTGGAAVILGTPGALGRIATDGTDVWTAMVEDLTTAQASWVKTHNG